MTAAIVGLIGVLVGYWVGYLKHRRDIGVKLIEIAIGILAAKPEDNKPLRDWAIKLLAHYSKEVNVPLEAEAQSDLEEKALPVTTMTFDPETGKITGSNTWMR